MQRSLLVSCAALAVPTLALQSSSRDAPALRPHGALDEECYPEQNPLALFRETSLAASEQTAQEAAQVAAAAPAPGDVFLGSLDGCSRGKGTGIRVAVERWPSKVRISYFPFAQYDNHERVFIKPGHDHTFEYSASGSGGGSGPVSFHPDAPSTKATNMARVAGRQKGAKQQSKKVGDDGIRFSLDANLDGNTLSGKLSSSEEKAKASPDFSCTSFKATKCTGEAPGQDEKVVVFMRHAAMNCELDPRLSELGINQVADHMHDPNLARMLSSDPSQQAEVVYMSPMARTMHTALLAFRERLPKAKFIIDPDLVELGGMGVINKDVGTGVLRQFGADKALLQSYNDTVDTRDAAKAPASSHHHHKASETNMMELNRGEEAPALHVNGPELANRFKAFVERLSQRPEKRFIVVSHKHLLKAGTSLDLDHAETGLKAFTADGQWRNVMQPPQCWKDAL